ncbi:MAG: molecular chaperone DnaJ [Hyphomicrobium sp.]
MPYSCSVSMGDVRLTPSPAVRYSIAGRREELAFVGCRAAANCATVMVHRFMLSCGGENVAWARVAAVAPGLGIALPEGLPAGYAPVGMLQGRFVLPALAKFTAHDGGVSSEPLSSDSVFEPADLGISAAPEASAWQTVIRAELRPEASSGALKVAGIVATLLALLLAIAMFAAGRWPLPAASLSSLRPRARQLWPDMNLWAKRLADDIFKHLARRGTSHAAEGGGEALLNALAIATARLAETELLLATLPRELLLREVLHAEVDQVRTRLGTVAREAGRRPAEKSAAIVRGALRDLDRISRIAHGALEDGADESRGEGRRKTFRMPGTAQEAYQMLGINAEAAPAVAKKLVDALRMSWHPDFASDENDRQVREARMKQINAAWDLIKERRQAA